ncbi:YezD family protein [Nitrospira sp. NS4]|uniref:YezD family protein n=1 Tax=Nitrospira sp. NS4 TaxID=3414498 RepID=UPI003C3061CD
MEIKGNLPKGADDILRYALKEIRYGSIEIVIHDSKIVQIERREKFRLDPTTTRFHQ